MARFPRVQFDDHLVADLSRTRQHHLPGVDVDVVDEARIVRDDVMELLGLLERADDVAVGALQDADNPAFQTRGNAGAAITPPVLVLEPFADDSRHDLVALESDPGVLGGDVKIGHAGFAAHDEGESFFR